MHQKAWRFIPLVLTLSFAMASPAPKDYSSRCVWHRGHGARIKKLPIVVVLPGGPGLSSGTVDAFSALNQDFDVCLMDSPGTGHTQALEHPTYDGVLADLEKAIVDTGREVILVGHSFGGIEAVELAVRGKFAVKRLVLLSTPLSKQSVDYQEAALTKFRENNPALVEADKKLQANPKDLAAFKEVLGLSGPLFFSPKGAQRGGRWLKKDLSAPSLASIAAEGKGHVELLRGKLAGLPFSKVSFASADDALLPIASLEKEARLFHASSFHSLKNVGHFPWIEDPSLVDRVRAEIMGLAAQTTAQHQQQ
jgi:proline iminopeptidase